MKAVWYSGISVAKGKVYDVIDSASFGPITMRPPGMHRWSKHRTLAAARRKWERVWCPVVGAKVMDDAVSRAFEPAMIRNILEYGVFTKIAKVAR